MVGTSVVPVQEQRLAEAAVPVPFLDLTHIHDGLRTQIVDEISKLIDTNAFTNGPHVAAFEEAFAGYCETRYCVGVASGLDALRLSLVAAGLERGDEVIVPAFTFAATFEAVSQAGGRPVAVDVGEVDYNLDADAAAASITEHTRFLVPVHLYGQMANVRAHLKTWPIVTAWASWRTPVRHQAPAEAVDGPALGAPPRRSASTRRRTSVPWGTRERSLRTTRS
jgi:DegT/DnrJ/EryC1/StrS aminotransferase family protein